jgi:Glycosyl transferase family 90
MQGCKNQSLLFSFMLVQLTLLMFTANVAATKSRRLNAPKELISTESLSTNTLPLTTNTLINTVRATTEPSTSIHEYLQSVTDGRQNMVLLKWNTSGVLVNSSSMMLEGHLPWIEPYLDGDFKYTTPSEHGKVAMIWVCDVMSLVPWDNTPPVPVIVYTMDRERLDSKNYILGPNPYDEGGYSEWQVNLLLNKFTDTMINTTFDTFNQRDNKLLWRGGNHGETTRKALVALTLAEEERFLREPADSLSTNTNKDVEAVSASTSGIWLDAKFSGGDDGTALTEEFLATNYKYHLDVGGVSGTSWEGLRWKMCSGNLVFRIETGAIDWWHMYLEPGVHYLEVKSDVSNLKEQHDWAESHPDEAYEIAQRGQQVCLQSYMKEHAKHVAIDLIQSLPEASAEQMAETDVILDEYYTIANSRNHDNKNNR